MENTKKNVPDIRFPGFTDVWEQRKLGEVATLTSSKRVHASDYVNQGIPFFRGSEISKLGGNSRLEDVLYISEDLYEQLKSNYGVPNENDILITAVGTLGNAFVIKGNTPFYFKDGNLIWLKNIQINSDYLGVYIGDGIGKQRVLNSAAGSNQKALTMVKLNDVVIDCPSEAEQKKIAEYFINLDNLITLHQRKCDELKIYKKGLLQQMFPLPGEAFPRVRFPGFTDPWEQRKLGELAIFSKGKGYSKSDLCDDGNPIILYGRLYTKYETVISKVDSFAEAKDGSVYSAGGEVIVPASGETAEEISIASVVANSGVLLGGDLNVITPSESLDPAFLAISITYGNPHNEMAKLAQGKTVVHLHNDDLKKIDLFFPSLDEQGHIRDLFMNIDNLITLHQRNILQHFYNHFWFI